ncbi:MAG: response regulator [Candidatus Rokubacteria bacterium]|nr:response regulator [Candidatus Rokubacteria bacterium]
MKSRRTITTGQAARHCEVSVPTIRRWMREGRLRGFTTVGRHVRIGLDEFRRFLREHGMPPYPAGPSETRILIADDEPEVIGLLAECLGTDPRHPKLETATDGYEVLIKVGLFRPSLLILDVHMPQLDGIKVCRRLKGEPETRAIKILGITGYPEAIPPLMEAGADGCLAKPLDFGQFRQQLDRLLPSEEA